MNHEYRMKFLNESRIIEVQQYRIHESWKSNDSASTPDSDRRQMTRYTRLTWKHLVMPQALTTLHIFTKANVI